MLHCDVPSDIGVVSATVVHNVHIDALLGWVNISESKDKKKIEGLTAAPPHKRSSSLRRSYLSFIATIFPKS
jgi:hypothetical protein